METQSKFLNKQYLETRIGEFREIKKKEVFFKIEESNRVLSKSLYVCFYIQSSNGFCFKNSTLRISDHQLAECPHTQFIIEPNNTMTKKKKAQFMGAVEMAIRKAKTRNFYKELNKISKEITTDENLLTNNEKL